MLWVVQKVVIKLSKIFKARQILSFFPHFSTPFSLFTLFSLFILLSFQILPLSKRRALIHETNLKTNNEKSFRGNINILFIKFWYVWPDNSCIAFIYSMSTKPDLNYTKLMFAKHLHCWHTLQKKSFEV